MKSFKRVVGRWLCGLGFHVTSLELDGDWWEIQCGRGCGGIYRDDKVADA